MSDDWTAHWAFAGYFQGSGCKTGSVSMLVRLVSGRQNQQVRPAHSSVLIDKAALVPCTPIGADRQMWACKSQQQLLLPSGP
jgi:hypothetical protein